MREITRVLKKNGKANIFVPHFSNPYYYSDYTHKRFLGLYTFYYFVETEMIANVGKKKLKYKEIPIATIYADKYKGTTVFDGIKIVFNLLIWRFKK